MFSDNLKLGVYEEDKNVDDTPRLCDLVVKKFYWKASSSKMDCQTPGFDKNLKFV